MGPELFGFIIAQHGDITAEAVGITGFAMYPGNPTPLTTLTGSFDSSSEMNWGNTPEIQALINVILVTVDDAARAALIKEVFQLITEYLPSVIIALPATSYAYNSNISYTCTNGVWNVPAFLSDLTIK